MKEELQGKLVEILTAMQTAAGKASDFAMEQLPDIAQSYVAYGRFLHTSSLALSLLAFGICLYIALRYGVYGKLVDRYGTWSEGRQICALVGGFCAAFAMAAVCINAPAFGLVWFAPKVWLLKEIAGMLK